MNKRDELLHMIFSLAFKLKKNFSDIISKYNLTEIEAKFIYHIGDGERKKTCELIDYFKKHKSTVRQKTKSLERKGFIEIEKSQGDKRERIINLTKKGEEFFLKIKKIREKYSEIIFQNFSKEEEDYLYSLLKKIVIKKDN